MYPCFMCVELDEYQSLWKLMFIFKIQEYLPYSVYLHHWLVVITPGKSKRFLRSMYCGADAYSEVGVADPSCMGKGKGCRSWGFDYSWMQKCLSGTGSSIQMLSSKGAVGKSSSSSSSSLVTSWKESLVRQWAICCSTGEDCSILSWSWLLFNEEFSSSLNVKWWHTELRLLCWWGKYVWCVSGVAGLKDKFSLVEMWYRHSVLCKGVGIFKLSPPVP